MIETHILVSEQLDKVSRANEGQGSHLKQIIAGAEIKAGEGDGLIGRSIIQLEPVGRSRSRISQPFIDHEVRCAADPSREVSRAGGWLCQPPGCIDADAPDCVIGQLQAEADNLQEDFRRASQKRCE